MAIDCTKISCGRTPIQDIGVGSYLGYSGGFYGGGSNVRPADLDARVLAAMATVVPDPTSGKIDVLYIGDDLSNSAFVGRQYVPGWASTIKTSVREINGANPAKHLEAWAGDDPSTAGDWMWTTFLPPKLPAGAVPRVAIFSAMYATFPHIPADESQRILYARDQYLLVFKKVKQYLPSVRVLFVIPSHEYLGYESLEPFCYDLDFGGQQSVIQQDPLTMPPTCWLGSAWANGTTPRSDGLAWLCADVGPGGHLVDGVGNKKLVQYVTLPWLQTDSATAALRV